MRGGNSGAVRDSCNVVGSDVGIARTAAATRQLTFGRGCRYAEVQVVRQRAAGWRRYAEAQIDGGGLVPLLAQPGVVGNDDVNVARCGVISVAERRAGSVVSTAHRTARREARSEPALQMNIERAALQPVVDVAEYCLNL